MHPDTSPRSDGFLQDIEDEVIEEDPNELMFEIMEAAEALEGNVDDSILTFSSHTDSVLCCNFNKSADLVVSGGVDDVAYAWDPNTGEVKFKATGHEESVVAAGFNANSTILATGDMGGVLQLWNMESQQKISRHEMDEITWIQWHDNDNILFVGLSSGICFKWTPGGTSFTAGSYTGTSCSCLFPGGEKIGIGYNDGSLRIWDIKKMVCAEAAHGYIVHRLPVICMKCHPTNPLMLSGSEDSTAKLVKCNDLKVVWSVPACSSEGCHSEAVVESVGFGHNMPLMITGSNCGCLTIWDSAAQMKRFNINLESSVVKLICSESSPNVYVGSSDGKLQLFDIRTGTVERMWNGHNLGILDFSLSRDWQKMVSASDDKTCKIFDVQ